MLFSAGKISALIGILSLSLIAATSPGAVHKHSTAKSPITTAKQAGSQPVTAAKSAQPPAQPTPLKPHFQPVDPTGNYMVVLVQASIHPTINGQELKKGDEIGAFNAAGLCVGSKPWLGDSKNICVSVWGDNLATPSVEGMKVGETILYRVWDSAQSKEYPAKVTYHTKPVIAPNGMSFSPTSAGTYVADGISVMATLMAPASQDQSGIELVSPADSSIITADSAEFAWSKGDSGSDKYAITISADSVSNIVLCDTLSDTSVVYRKLKPGAAYWWSISVHGKSGWGSSSQRRTFNVGE